MMHIFIALLILSFLIFFHEFGHFVVARICGVKVEVFSIGFGKKLLSVHFRGTQYALSLIPLGGYVKLKGQDMSQDLQDSESSNLTHPSESHFDNDSYLAKTPIQRIAILLAGPMSNFILAFILYMFVGLGGNLALLPIVGEVKEGFPAYVAGMQSGDKILAVNGQGIKAWRELDSLIARSVGEIELELERAGQRYFVQLTPVMTESSTLFGERKERKVIGIVSKNEVGEVVYYGWESVGYALDEIFKAGGLIIQGVVKFVSGVIPSSEVGGVVSIVSVIGTASQNEFTTLLWFTALISVNLGILNLLPIPALDGGHIIFNLYELLRGRAPNAQVMYYFTLGGWAVLLSLMFLGLYNDIFRLIS